MEWFMIGLIIAALIILAVVLFEQKEKQQKLEKEFEEYCKRRAFVKILPDGDIKVVFNNKGKIDHIESEENPR